MISKQVISTFAFGVLFMILSATTLSGDLQKVIHFSSGLSELIFCVSTAAFGILFLISSVITDNEVN